MKEISTIFVRQSHLHSRKERKSENDLAVPLMELLSSLKAFSYRGTKVWNKFNNKAQKNEVAW